MSHSTHVGFKAPPRVIDVPVREPPLQIASVSDTPAFALLPSRFRDPLPRESPTVGVGKISLPSEDKKSRADVRRGLFGSAEQIPLRIEPDAGQVFEHFSQTVLDVPSDVFAEDCRRPAFDEHAQNLRPKVPGVFGAEVFSCAAEGLARVARCDNPSM